MNKDELKQFLLKHIAEKTFAPVPVTWSTLLCFCYGYFGKVTSDMIEAVRELELDHWF